MQQASPRAGTDIPSANLPPADSFPGYELVREVHRGGQGAVYLAIQKATKRRVAIKVMHGGPFQGSSGRARFEREVQVLGQLNHPNIVRIHDSGVSADGSCFYVMDYISGRSLDEIISESSKDPIEQSLKLFVRICDAVNAAHLKGVIHRDLKPANVRLSASGEPIVVDFGLAKTAVAEVTDESHPQVMTMTGQFIGSLPWASPEQAEGTPDRIDLRTDVYSLGVILYQLLTGRFPYDVAGNVRDVLDNILKAEPAKPSTVRRRINDEVETIILKCLSKDRDRRYQTAGELARDIQHYLAGEPIEAKRDSGWYQVSKILRRHRFAASFAITVLVLIVVFGIVMSIAWSNETRERTRADANFELVRDQARTLMYDFNQAVANLRGGTRVRELLFLKARESLDRLKAHAGNASDDPGLRREIADASDLLGDIRGGLYLPRAGDAGSAKQSYADARTIREVLLDTHPSEFRSHADMAESHKRSAQVLMTELKYPEAEVEAGKGVAAFDAAIRLAANEPAPTLNKLNDGRTSLVLLQGDACVAAAEAPKTGSDPDTAAVKARLFYDQAEAYWQRRVTAEPRYLPAARALGVCRDKQAAAITLRGTILVKQAEPLMKADAAKAAGLVGKAADQFGEARALAQSALADFERLSKLHAENAEWRRDIYLALHNIGNTHMLTGAAYRALEKSTGDGAAGLRSNQEWTQAATVFAQAQRVTNDLAGSDQSNVQARRDQVIVQNKAGNILRDLGNLQEAEEVFKRSLEVRKDLNQTDQTPRTRRDLAIGFYKLAEVYDLQAQAAGQERKRDLFRLAEQLYSQSFAEFDGLRDAGGTTGDQARAKEVGVALEECRKKLGSLPPS